MPLTIFSSSVDPSAALPVLQSNGFEIVEMETGWEATKSFRTGMFKKVNLKASFDREWCSPPNWPVQISGMQNYFDRFPIPDAMGEQVRSLIGSFQTSIALMDEPEYSDDDPRFEVIHEITAAVDGVLFTPGSLLDAAFNTLIDAEGNTDLEARFPQIPVTEGTAEGQDSIADEGEEEPVPPSASRVAQRALCLTAVSARGLLEMNLLQGNEPAYSHSDVLAWLNGLDIEDELEPQERAFLRTNPREASEPDTLDAVWRLEGLGVLAWALGLKPMAPYDQVVDTDSLLDTLGFQPDPGRAEGLLKNPVLKSPNALAKFQEQMFAFHWRLVDFRVNGKEVNYRKMQEECWFGPLDLSWAEFAGDDLAIQGLPITQVDPDVAGMVSSIAMERHLAANWLMGESEVYSETDVST